MKATIHPQWFNATVKCACGNTYTVGATKSDIRIDICSKCHPFFTGSMKFVDTLGRVEKFQKKQEFAQSQKTIIQDRKVKDKQREEKLRTQKSLKDMLMGLR